MPKLIPFLLLLLLLSCKADKPPRTTQALIRQADSLIESHTDSIFHSPKEVDYDSLIWTEITFADSVMLDLRYATTHNFTQTQIYPCSRCFLRRPVAQKFLLINQQLIDSKGLKMKLFDCYRPLGAQQKLWDIVPDETYVANPKKGSMHNRGAAVDVTLVDKDDNELDMGSDFDAFGSVSRHDNFSLPKEILINRALLKSTMEAAGFKSIKSEWWHYSLSGTGSPVTDWQWPCPE